MQLSDKCHPSKKIVIHTERKHYILVAKLTHSLQRSFLHWVKVILSGIGWATARYKVIRWLLSLARSLQSVIIYFCGDKFSDSGVANLSLFHCSSGEPVRQLTRYLMGCAGNSHSHSAETDSGSRMHDITLSNKKYLYIRITLNWNNHI